MVFHFIFPYYICKNVLYLLFACYCIYEVNSKCLKMLLWPSIHFLLTTSRNHSAFLVVIMDVTSMKEIRLAFSDLLMTYT